MKMRINESELRKMIKASLLKEAKVNLTDRKVVNQNKFVGDYKQRFESEDVDKIPCLIVTVSDFQDEDTYDRFYRYAQDRDLLSDVVPEKQDRGFGLFKHDLVGTVNQLFGLQKFADTTVESNGVGNDPFPYTYGAPINRMSPIPEKCPFDFSGEAGMVTPKDGADQYLQGFDVYDGSEAQPWDFATEHDGTVIFFFGDMGEKNNFVRQIKNMYMIARHVNKEGKFAYRFDTTHDNQQLKINEYTNRDPLEFLDEWDTDLREKIEAIIKQQEDKAAEGSQTQQVEPEIVDNPEDLGDTPSMGNEPEQDFDNDAEVGHFQDNVFRDSNGNILPASMANRTKPIREGKMKIKESQIRKMVRKILKEMIEK